MDWKFEGNNEARLHLGPNSLGYILVRLVRQANEIRAYIWDRRFNLGDGGDRTKPLRDDITIEEVVGNIKILPCSIVGAQPWIAL